MPLQFTGVVDVNGEEVPDNDLLAHAMSNAALPSADLIIKRGSAFINEYARVRENTLERTDGGPSNPNHLLGAFPVLFPYGMGGFEVHRAVDVPYESHARWALQYADRRFRKDMHFMFQVFGVIQKRQVCRSATLEMKKSTFVANQALYQTLRPSDLMKASAEETRRAPYSNDAVRALRSQLSAVRSKVAGTDESRLAIRSQIWSTSVMKNTPSIWLTINPADVADPLVQVFTGEEIDMDNFHVSAGPDSHQRSLNVAGDPYAAAKFFHFVVELVLEELFGIRAKNKQANIIRTQGVLGKISSYIGTVEAQGRGTLHLHMIIWLEGSPTAPTMKRLLQSEAFCTRISEYIKANIRADLNGANASEVARIEKVPAVAYSRPVDPRMENYDTEVTSKERTLARAVQLHMCTKSNCLEFRKGNWVCKRRAPFELAGSDWIKADGSWGPKRTCGYLNNWNPAVLQAMRCNHDIKLITNGEETKDISFYITNYDAKKQKPSSNTSALLAKRLAFHRAQEKYNADLNQISKRLIQRCANTLSRDHEFSAPEVVSYLMGWGDRFLSHHYVPIYWDGAMTALKKKFPELKNE